MKALKKLKLNKETVSALNDNQMLNVKGGDKGVQSRYDIEDTVHVVVCALSEGCPGYYEPYRDPKMAVTYTC
jgi:natural product precursor